MIELLRKKEPLAHLLVHDMVKAVSANSTLVLGASPLCADNPDEVEEMTGRSDLVYGNLGSNTRDRLKSIKIAAEDAMKRGIPFLLDVSGTAASAHRRSYVYDLAKEGKITILKGNASEIIALYKDENTARGVDSETESKEAVEAGIHLTEKTAEIVCITGKTDYITDGKRGTVLKGGSSDMPKVTGTGCIGSLLTGLFSTVELYEGAVYGMGVNAVCGEKAIRSLREKGLGIGFYYAAFISALEELKEEDLADLEREEFNV